MFVRAVERGSGRIGFTVDGKPAFASDGDSLLTAILTNGGHLRRNEVDDQPRAGFCLMGACQDCWVWLAGAERARACTTPVAPGMQVSTIPPQFPTGDNG